MSSQPSLVELDDYLHGGLSDAAAEQLEERLFAAVQGGDAGDLEFLDTLQRRATWLADEGQFGESYTRVAVEALLARDANVHRVDVLRGGLAEIPMWKPETKRVVFHLDLDLRGYDDVEIVAHSARGEKIITFREVQCDPEDGGIYAVCMEPVARMALSVGTLHWQVSAQRSGKREKLADYATRLVAADGG